MGSSYKAIFSICLKGKNEDHMLVSVNRSAHL